MEFETFEKLILHRNFRTALKGNLASSFDMEHIQMIHEKLCYGLDHRDGVLKSGELRVSKGVAGQLGREANKLASHVMASTDKKFIAQRAAYVMTRIETVRPFHSLNSMVGKLFSHNFAQTAGFNIDWAGMKKDDMTKSIKAAKAGNLDSLVQQIEKNLHSTYEHNQKQSMESRFGSDFSKRAEEFKLQLKNNTDHGLKKPTIKVGM